jgi:hypothetical protein
LDHNFPLTKFILTRLYPPLCFVEDDGIFPLAVTSHKSHLPGCSKLSMDESTQKDSYSDQQPSPEETKTNASSTLLQKSKKSQTSTSSTITSLATNWWLLELLAAVFALAIFVALVVLLWSYHDAPVPQWPHGITVSGSRPISIVASLLTRKAQRGDLHSFHHHKVITVDGVGRGDQSVKVAVVPEYWCIPQTV